MVHKTALVAVLIGLLALPTSAFSQPVTFAADDTGKSVSVAYDGLSNGSSIEGLASSATFTLTGVENGFHGETPAQFFNFDYSISNKSSLPAELSGFAFRTNPSDYVIGFAGGAFGDFEGASTYPDGVGAVDACFGNFGDPSHCGTSDDTGIYPGEVGFGTFRLAFYDALSFLTFDDFFVRYDWVDDAGEVGSASGQGTITNVSSGGEPVPVPEPGMLAMFALGVGALFARQRGFSRSRRLALQPART
jgi:hypothetical protein